VTAEAVVVAPGDVLCEGGSRWQWQHPSNLWQHDFTCGTPARNLIRIGKAARRGTILWASIRTLVVRSRGFRPGSIRLLRRFERRRGRSGGRRQ
jgi:hypothetical protein